MCWCCVGMFFLRIYRNFVPKVHRFHNMFVFKLRRFCRQGSLSWSFSWWDELGRTLGVTCGNMRKANGLGSIPIGSMYDVFTYILMISMVNVKVNLPYMHHMGYDVQISCCETSLFLEKTYHGTRIVRLSSLVNCQKGKWFLKKIWSINFLFVSWICFVMFLPIRN